VDEGHHVHLQHVELGTLGVLRDGAVQGVAGVVDEHVDRALGILDLPRDGARRGGIDEVGGDDERARAVHPLELDGERLERLLAARDEDEVMAVHREESRDRLADSPGRAGDERGGARRSRNVRGGGAGNGHDGSGRR
jgi:hypothetical protein